MELFSNSDSLFFPKLAKTQLKKTFTPDTLTQVIEMNEESTKYSLELSVEDGKKEDFSMQLQGDILTISRVQAWGDYSGTTTAFESNISMPKGVDLNNISIDCTSGILKITVPKI